MRGSASSAGERVGPARRRRAAALLAGALGCLCAAAPATGHVVYGRAALSELIAGADLVARARIVAPAPPVVGHDGPRPAVTAELAEILKGEAASRRVRFVQHGHGVAVFEKDEEVLLFLRAIARSRELAGLAETSDLRYVSVQEHDAKFALDAGSRRPIVEAVRAYVGLDALPAGEERLESLRELTFRLLGSPEERLATSALRDLVVRGEVLLSAGSVARVEPLIDDPTVAIGIRLGVLAELDRLGRIDAEPRWARLLRGARGPDLIAVVRAAGAHPSPAVNRELIRLLASGERDVAPPAAIALGVAGNRAAVVPLATALEQGDLATTMAAVRALGSIAVPEAVAALERAAGTHPEESVRRRARAEIRRLGIEGR